MTTTTTRTQRVRQPGERKRKEKEKQGTHIIYIIMSLKHLATIQLTGHFV